MPALLAMQLIWYLTWVSGNESGIVTGLTLAAAAMPLARRQPARRPPDPRQAGPRQPDPRLAQAGEPVGPRTPDTDRNGGS